MPIFSYSFDAICEETTFEEQFFPLVGPSGSGKFYLIFDWLKIGTFQPAFENFLNFYQHSQHLYSQVQRKNLKFTQGVDFDLIEKLPKNGTKYLLIFDDSCEEFSNFKQFVKIATAGRENGLNTIYIKHNLFHRSKLGRDVELQNKHTVLFKSLREVSQINTLSQQLILGGRVPAFQKFFRWGRAPTGTSNLPKLVFREFWQKSRFSKLSG